MSDGDFMVGIFVGAVIVCLFVIFIVPTPLNPEIEEFFYEKCYSFNGSVLEYGSGKLVCYTVDVNDYYLEHFSTDDLKLINCKNSAFKRDCEVVIKK